MVTMIGGGMKEWILGKTVGVIRRYDCEEDSECDDKIFATSLASWLSPKVTSRRESGLARLCVAVLVTPVGTGGRGRCSFNRNSSLK